tara:strand:- start:19 stop:399 length:381 start_codon:yes stop_codon:yes gene_type:complete
MKNLREIIREEIKHIIEARDFPNVEFPIGHGGVQQTRNAVLNGKFSERQAKILQSTISHHIRTAFTVHELKIQSLDIDSEDAAEKLLLMYKDLKDRLWPLIDIFDGLLRVSKGMGDIQHAEEEQTV